MSTTLLRITFLLVLASCSTSSRVNHSERDSDKQPALSSDNDLTAGMKPDSLTNLPRTNDGAFVLKPGFYEGEFKTYCLQPGTPDPTPNHAYLHAPMTGYRKEIVQSILYNSRSRSDINQRNVQLLLWSVVSGSDYNKLSRDVRNDAEQLLTSKQIFELKGGVLGVVRTVSSHIPGGGKYGSEMKRLFEMGTSSYEAYERIAVLREMPKVKRANFKNDQWYKQSENYYLRVFPVSYQKVRMQVYVPDGVLDSAGKVNNDYVVFDPTGLQAVPANSNAQRLGIGGPVLDIVKVIIDINRDRSVPRTKPDVKRPPRIDPKPKADPKVSPNAR
jgi:hypothetical protein